MHYIIQKLLAIAYLLCINLVYYSISNISLIQSLNIIQKECNMSVWKCILAEIIKRINQGEAFSTKLKCYPKLFPEIIYRLLEIGEQTNSLKKNC